MAKLRFKALEKVQNRQKIKVSSSSKKISDYFEQLIFPDEVHGFLLQNNWVRCMEATFEFIDRHIGVK